MRRRSDPATEGIPGPPAAHGGNQAAARLLFPDAPDPLIDLSTGINPHSYPVTALPPEVFTRLPEPDAVVRLEALAAERYGAASAAHVVAAPGTQILLPLIAALMAPPGVSVGAARVLGPTYAEHVRAARLAGLEGREVTSVRDLAGARLAVVVNPNNPDGRRLSRAVVLETAHQVNAAGGALVVDEAFVEVAPDGTSVAADATGNGLLVLRSFGKFHGLAGVRLGFAITGAGLAAELRARLGPWAVSGPALALGMRALADQAWAERMRARLADDAARLDRLLQAKGLLVCGGTPLFRFVRGPVALYQRLGCAGIMVRAFPERAGYFRLGLPGDDAAWARLEAALGGG